jgi:hypothetical protein
MGVSFHQRVRNSRVQLAVADRYGLPTSYFVQVVQRFKIYVRPYNYRPDLESIS